jgi:peptidase A4-like protein
MRGRPWPWVCLAACVSALGLLVAYSLAVALGPVAAPPASGNRAATGSAGLTRPAHAHPGAANPGAVNNSAVNNRATQDGAIDPGEPPAHADHQHSAPALAAARSALRSLKIGQPARDVQVGAIDPGVTTDGPVSSSNWSGYADDNTTGNTYSQVAGTWTEPSISCGPQEESLAAFWVGIDGYTSGSVEQDGTLADCEDGTAFYFTWWEMFPANDAQIVGETVNPGDTITASVVRSGTSYKLTLTDATSPANSFTTTQSCVNCANSSAEWIAEAPTEASSGQLVSLSDFRSWSLSNASATSGSGPGVISTFPDDQIFMINSSGSTEAEPLDLDGNGNVFDIIWGTELPVLPARTNPAGHPAGSPQPARTPPQ